MTRPSLGGLGPFKRRCVICNTRPATQGEVSCEECQRAIDDFRGDPPIIDEAVEAEYGFTERGGHRAAR